MRERKSLVHFIQNGNEKKAWRSDFIKNHWKHWKSLAKIDLTKKLSFNSTFLKVYLVLGKK